MGWVVLTRTQKSGRYSLVNLVTIQSITTAIVLATARHFFAEFIVCVNLGHSQLNLVKLYQAQSVVPGDIALILKGLIPRGLAVISYIHSIHL